MPSDMQKSTLVKIKRRTTPCKECGKPYRLIYAVKNRPLAGLLEMNHCERCLYADILRRNDGKERPKGGTP